MKVQPTRDDNGNLGFELLPENETEKNLLTDFVIADVIAEQTISDNLVTKLKFTGTTN